MANLNDVLFTPDSLVDDWIKEDRRNWGRFAEMVDNYVSIYNSVHELPTLDEFLLETCSILDIEEEEKNRIKDILNTKAEAAWVDGLKGEERIERGINEYIEELEKEYPIEENQKDSLKTRFRDIANNILELLGKTYANVGFIKYNIVNGNNYVKLLKLFENIRNNNKEELREYKKLEDGENASISDHEDIYQLWNFGNTILEIYCWINLHRKDTFLFNGKIKLKYFIENYEEPKNFNDYFDELVNEYKIFIDEKYKEFYLDEQINSFNNLPSDISEEGKKRVLKHLEVDQLSQYIHEELPTYWKVSPGENAKYWDGFKENNVIGIGWIKDTNLDEIDLDSDLEEALKDNDEYDANGQNKGQIKRFVEGINKGDYIIANKGQNKILGIGKVTTDYKYNNSITYPHTREVDWLWTGEQKIKRQDGWRLTVQKPLDYETIAEIKRHNYFWVNQKREVEIEEEFLEALVDNNWGHDLSKLKEGDTVFNYYDGNLIGFSEVLESPRIIEENGEDKYRVDIELNRFDSEVTKEEYIDYLMEDEVRTDKYYPLNKNGGVNRGYLFELSKKAGKYLLDLHKKGIDEIKESVFLNERDAKKTRKEFVKLFRYLEDLDDIKPVINTTYVKNRNKISVNLGHWQIYSIEKSGNEYVAQFSVDTKLLPDDYDKWSFLKKDLGEFDKGEGIRLIRVYWNKDLLDNNPRLEDAWRSSVKLGKKLFSDWSKSPYNKHHNEEIYDWIIDGFPKPEKETLLDLNNGELVFESLDVTDGLYFPEGMKKEINQSIKVALSSGKHIIFTGPPGTGKTKIAKNTAEHLDNNCDCVHGYIFTTATADWTTFDTIGGYQPKKETNGLKFKAGQFLKCFKNSDEEPVNKWLIIDEINRADIDKAFGQLFSTLSNDKVELPFTNENNKTISLIPLENNVNDFDYSEENYYMTSNWRLLGTMNTYDKASLYEMSYAFMRRFAFIDVSVPTENIDAELISKYVEVWDELTLKDVGEYVGSVSELWKTLNKGKRAIGPAIIKDILLFLKESKNLGLVNALKLYVLPQLEGMVKQDQKQLIKDLGDVIEEEEELYRVAEERFEIDKEKLENE